MATATGPTSEATSEPNGEDDLLTYAEASLLLALPIGTLYSWVSTYKIPHHRFSGRLVRFSRAKLESWIEEHSVGVHPPRPMGPSNSTAAKRRNGGR